MSSGSRNRVPCSSVRASLAHTLRSAPSQCHLHPTCSHRTIDLVSHNAHLSLTALPLPHDLLMIVSLVHAQQQQTDLQSQPSIFSSPAARSLGFFFACGGPRCANFRSTFLRRLHAMCSSSSSSSSSNSNSQARGKGAAPEAGPWHGAAGLRVKPERAALRRRRRLVAIAVIAVPLACLVCPRPSTLSRHEAASGVPLACAAYRSGRDGRLLMRLPCAQKSRKKAFWHADDVNFFRPAGAENVK